MIYLGWQCFYLPTHICVSTSLHGEHCCAGLRPHCIMWRITRAPRLGWDVLLRVHVINPTRVRSLTQARQHNTTFYFVANIFYGKFSHARFLLPNLRVGAATPLSVFRYVLVWCRIFLYCIEEGYDDIKTESSKISLGVKSAFDIHILPLRSHRVSQLS